MIKTLNSKGSILIWTVLLGVLLATAFLFFSLRFGDGKALQRLAMDQANQKAYVESYSNYIQALPEADLMALEGELSFDEGQIVGQLTNNVEALEGVLDAGQQKTFEGVAGGIVIRFNLCGPSGDPIEFGTLDIDQVTGFGSSDQCGLGGGYDNFITSTVSSPFNLTATNAPLHYRVEWLDTEAGFDGEQCTLQLVSGFGNRNRVEVEEVFVPSA